MSAQIEFISGERVYVKDAYHDLMTRCLRGKWFDAEEYEPQSHLQCGWRIAINPAGIAYVRSTELPQGKP